MQKKEFIKKIAERTHNKIVDVERVFDAAVWTISEAYCNDERIDLRGFGSFSKKVKKARKGHDFVTGKTIETPAKEVLTFKVSSLFNQNKK